MARSVDIDFTFKRSVDVSAVIRLLLASRTLEPRAGELPYLIDEDGMFDWRMEDPSRIDEVASKVGEPRWRDRTVGITLSFPNSSTGGDFLFHPGREVLSCVIGINPRLMVNSAVFCDIGWYLAKLVPVLEPLGLVELETRDSM